MGKAQKIKVSKKNQVTSVAPLGDQLHSSEVAAPTGRVKERNRLDEDEDYVESRLSKNIITQARLQVILTTDYSLLQDCNFSLIALCLLILYIAVNAMVKSAVQDTFACISILETRYSRGIASPARQPPGLSLY